MSGSERVSEAIPVRYDFEECVVRLQQNITAQSIFNLCEEIDFAIEYYQYSKIAIEIDSIGGDVSYLEYYFGKLDEWLASGVIIRTVGLTVAASASAYILSSGSLGFRTSFPATRIVFHYGSAGLGEGVSLTKLELDRRSKRLFEIDQQFEARVVNQVLSQIQALEIKKYPTDEYPSEVSESVRETWKQIGIKQKDVGRSNTLSDVDVVKEIIASVHTAGMELTPWVASSLLLIDKPTFPSDQLNAFDGGVT